jgi:hypothetical protein
MKLDQQVRRELSRHPNLWAFDENQRFLRYSVDGIRLVRPIVGEERWSLVLPWGLVKLSWRTHFAIEWVRIGRSATNPHHCPTFRSKREGAMGPCKIAHITGNTDAPIVFAIKNFKIRTQQATMENPSGA